MPYFVESTPLRRSLLALTGIVAVGAVYLGVSGYVQRQHDTKGIADTNSPTAVDSNNLTGAKKNSTKPRRSTTSSRNGKSLVQELAATELPANAQETSLISEEVPSMNTVSGAIQEFGTELSPQGQPKSNPSPRSCVPLPNSTKAEDVDADYYRKWAREYGCVLD